MDDNSQDCVKMMSTAIVTVIVVVALYGALDSSYVSTPSRPALRHYQVHHVDASVGSPASSHKCGGGDHKCGQARVGPRWSSTI